MVLAVPPETWPQLQELCAGEDVEATVLGRFEATGRLRLFYQGQQVADLDLHFLHDGRPPVVRQATWRAGGVSPLLTPNRGLTPPARPENFNDVLLKILASPNVCSKEWIIRQYDHEVQGGSVVKPLVGVDDDGPGDAAVVMPVLGSWTGLAVGCGINPRYGDLDPYAMAAAAIDEAVRNVVAVGADPSRIALLDNFCWGNTDRPEVLGSLVRAAEACRDVALAYGMPFISGKDSLKNEYHSGGRQHRHPADAAHQRPGPRPGRAPLRDDGPEGAGQPPVPRRRDAGTRWAARTTTSCTDSTAGRCRGRTWNWRRASSASCTRRSWPVWCVRATT